MKTICFPTVRSMCFALLAGLMIAGASSAGATTVRQACAPDYHSLCSGVQPGGGRIAACFKANAAKLSPNCKQALQAAEAAHKSSSDS